MQVIVISVKTKSGILKSRRVCESSSRFFLNIFQASRSKRKVSAMDKKKVIPTLSRVLKSNVSLRTEI